MKSGKKPSTELQNNVSNKENSEQNVENFRKAIDASGIGQQLFSWIQRRYWEEPNDKAEQQNLIKLTNDLIHSAINKLGTKEIVTSSTLDELQNAIKEEIQQGQKKGFVKQPLQNFQTRPASILKPVYAQPPHSSGPLISFSENSSEKDINTPPTREKGNTGSIKRPRNNNRAIPYQKKDAQNQYPDVDPVVDYTLMEPPTSETKSTPQKKNWRESLDKEHVKKCMKEGGLDEVPELKKYLICPHNNKGNAPSF